MGLQPSPLLMSWKIGGDSKPIEWYQKTMFQYSCQPENLVWQTRQDNRTFPEQITYFYGQGPMNISLPSVVLTNAFNYHNIDHKVYLDYDYTILFTSSATGPTKEALTQITLVERNIVIDQKDGSQQWIIFGAQAVSKDFYYYTKQPEGKVYQGSIDINLTQIANVSFVYNEAPTFAIELQQLKVSVNDSITIALPDIFDPDSTEAHIYQIMTFPLARFVSLQNSGRKTGSNITLHPTREQDSGSYLCQLGLIDVGPNPRKNFISFTILVSKFANKNQTLIFLPDQNGTNITFQTDDRIGIKLDLIYPNQTVRLKFNFPMETYINPFFTINNNQTTNLTEVLYSYLQISHQHLVVYTRQNLTQPVPKVQALAFDGLNLLLDLQFPFPGNLSQSQTESMDYIKLTFNETALFLSKNHRLAGTRIWEIEFKLSLQPSSNDKLVATVTQNTMFGVMTANFVINLLMSTSLQKMWGNVNVLQLIVATPLLQVNMPLNAQTLCQALLSITQFQLFDATFLTDKVFGRSKFAPNQLIAMNDRLNLGGYQAINFIYNWGCMFYITFLLLTLYIFTFCLEYLQKVLKSKSLGRVLRKIWRKLTIQTLIRLFFELTFDIGLCSYIQIRFLTPVTSGVDVFSDFLAIQCATLCFLVPARAAYILFQLHKQKALHNESTIRKFGALYEQQLVPRPTLMHIFYNVFFVLRRLTTIFCIFAFQSVPSFQMGVMMWMTTFWMAYSISTKPFEDPQLNQIEVFNETIYNFILLLCFTFTDLLPDLGTRSNTGFGLIILILTLIAVNISIQIKELVQKLKLNVKRWQIMFKLKQDQWVKPQFKHTYMPHSSKVTEILENEYRKRIFNDLVSEAKNKVTDTFKSPKQKHHQTKLINVKTKPMKPTKNNKNNGSNQKTQINAVNPLSIQSRITKNLSDTVIVDQFMREEEQKQQLAYLRDNAWQSSLVLPHNKKFQQKQSIGRNQDRLAEAERQEMYLNQYIKKKESEDQRDQLMRQIEQLELLGVLDKYLDHGSRNK